MERDGDSMPSEYGDVAPPSEYGGAASPSGYGGAPPPSAHGGTLPPSGHGDWFVPPTQSAGPAVDDGWRNEGPAPASPGYPAQVGQPPAASGRNEFGRWSDAPGPAYGVPAGGDGYGPPDAGDPYHAPRHDDGYDAPRHEGYGAPQYDGGNGARQDDGGYGAPRHDGGNGAPQDHEGYGAPRHEGYGVSQYDDGSGASRHEGYGASRHEGYGAPRHDDDPAAPHGGPYGALPDDAYREPSGGPGYGPGYGTDPDRAPGGDAAAAGWPGDTAPARFDGPLDDATRAQPAPFPQPLPPPGEPTGPGGATVPGGAEPDATASFATVPAGEPGAAGGAAGQPGGPMPAAPGSAEPAPADRIGALGNAVVAVVLFGALFAAGRVDPPYGLAGCVLVQVVLVLGWVFGTRRPGPAPVAVVALGAGLVADGLAAYSAAVSLAPFGYVLAGGLLAAAAGQLARGGGRGRVTDSLASTMFAATGTVAVPMVVMLSRLPDGAVTVLPLVGAAGAAVVVARLIDVAWHAPRASAPVPRGVVGVLVGGVVAGTAVGFVAGRQAGLADLHSAVAGLVVGLAAVLADVGVSFGGSGRELSGEPAHRWPARFVLGPAVAAALAAPVAYVLGWLVLLPQ